MKIRHTHPAYESREERMERLREAYKSCMELVSAQRDCAKEKAGKGTGR